MLNVVCLEAGNYLGRGIDYVASLCHAVERHLTTPYTFTVFTDRTTIEYYGKGHSNRFLPHPGLKGWMNKLALFKPDLFLPGQRILYFDLDTLITGSLDDIAAYAGKFAMLEDLTQPTHLGSGLMAWAAGDRDLEDIWLTYEAADCPEVRGGDQVWIEGWARARSFHVDHWQDLYPNQVQSYKVGAGVLNPHMRVCCFHGRPRPHEVTQGWVPRIWEGHAS